MTRVSENDIFWNHTDIIVGKELIENLYLSTNGRLCPYSEEQILSHEGSHPVQSYGHIMIDMIYFWDSSDSATVTIRKGLESLAMTIENEVMLEINPAHPIRIQYTNYSKKGKYSDYIQQCCDEKDKDGCCKIDYSKLDAGDYW